MQAKFYNRIFLLLFVLVVFVYCFCLAPLGFEFWDTGYISSFSWRICNGELPYRDFIYKGPPLTLFFHAFWMEILPNQGQFLLMRMVNYLLFAIQVFWVVTGFFNLYKKELQSYNQWAIMTLCFVVSILNFSPYPWPTTDGLFFASLAFYISSTKKANPLTIFVIALLAFLAALTKQSFYPVPLLFVAWITLQHHWKKGLLMLFFTLLFLTIFILTLESNGILHQFIAQTTGETKLNMLISSGFLNYFWVYPNKGLYYVLIALGAVFLIYFQQSKKAINLKTSLTNLGIATLVFAFFTSIFHSFLIGSRIAFVACCIAIFADVVTNFNKVKYFSTALLLLGISWCSAISMGYPFPILFGTGIILTVLLVFKESLLFLHQKRLIYPVVLLLCLCAFATNRYPYREQYFDKLNCRLDAVSSKLAGIKTSKENFSKLMELKKLIQQFQSPYIVAPNLSQSHYLFNDQSILPADWLINTEINRNPELFITIAKNSKAIIFLEKSFLHQEELMTVKRADFSIVADYIYRNFKPVGETHYFIIYKGIQKNEPIPKVN